MYTKRGSRPLPDPTLGVSQEGVGKVVQGSELRLEAHAAHVDHDTLAQLVVMVQGLEAREERPARVGPHAAGRVARLARRLLALRHAILMFVVVVIPAAERLVVLVVQLGQRSANNRPRNWLGMARVTVNNAY